MFLLYLLAHSLSLSLTLMVIKVQFQKSFTTLPTLPNLAFMLLYPSSTFLMKNDIPVILWSIIPNGERWWMMGCKQGTWFFFGQKVRVYLNRIGRCNSTCPNKMVILPQTPSSGNHVIVVAMESPNRCFIASNHDFTIFQFPPPSHSEILCLPPIISALASHHHHHHWKTWKKQELP